MRKDEAVYIIMAIFSNSFNATSRVPNHVCQLNVLCNETLRKEREQHSFVSVVMIILHVVTCRDQVPRIPYTVRVGDVSPCSPGRVTQGAFIWHIPLRNPR